MESVFNPGDYFAPPTVGPSLRLVIMLGELVHGGAASLSHKPSVNQAAMPSRPRANVDAVLGHVVE